MSVMYARDKDRKLVAVPMFVSSGGNADLGVAGATIGQTVKITEVDENGVPTAWESVDFPSGGGSGGEKLVADGTKIATGTIPSGTVAWGNGSFGVTIGDLKEWKKFRIAITLGVGCAFALRANGKYIHNNTSGSVAKQRFDLEWIDTDRTILGGYFVQNDASINTGTATLVGNQNGGFASSAAWTPVTYRVLDDSYNNHELNWGVNKEQTTEGAWSIFGILKYGEE